MHQLVYVSAATSVMGGADLNDILDASRRNNRAHGVTGLLLHIEQGFLQVLEGPEAAVEETYARIGRDSRHFNCRAMIRQHIDQRLFGDWSMGFDHLTPEAAGTADVFTITSDAINNLITPGKAAEIAIFLKSFYQVHAGRFAA
ncbi:MAG: BLUF domain-containing protein [Alphaproteobacteria bacterium]|nr:BLUF domain-containing protein [Alphaproteobacteria bacterium]MDE2162061.1 BLUF domain-containing protein [Alphaproteobacteria bacterium]MDE2499662.1 BLUF domain-containing protein [Alphaproteobacteria bacterium]